MSRPNDAERFFQTSDSIATIERKAAKAKNKHGRPIKLHSKILAVHPDPFANGKVFIAEAAGEVKRVVLETGDMEKIPTQASAPLTCLTVCKITKRLFAGCWDKQIYSTTLDRSQSRDKMRFSGHMDFLKCLLATSLHGKPILLSGGADATIIVWDITTGKQMHKLKGHTQALQDFAIDPLSLPEEGSQEPKNSFTLFSASSDREIRRWHITIDSAYELPESVEKPILAHETSVYKLRFDSEGDLWTASADNTAKHLDRARNWEADTVLKHPDFVRDIIVSERLGLAVTACRDEEVRVWDASSGALVCTYSGHFEEVSGLLLDGESNIVSASIDGTIRQWSLDRKEIARYFEDARQERSGEATEVHNSKARKMLTAEEEAELAELLEDED